METKVKSYQSSHGNYLGTNRALSIRTCLNIKYVAQHIQFKRESHICCPSRLLRPTTAHPCRRATQTSRRYDNNPTSFGTKITNESVGIVIPMSIYRCFILGKGLKVVVSRGQEQAQINAFHIMSFPHLPCLLMRLYPDGVRTYANLPIIIIPTSISPLNPWCIASLLCAFNGFN